MTRNAAEGIRGLIDNVTLKMAYLVDFATFLYSSSMAANPIGRRGSSVFLL
jgi:hypothetical protein